MSLFTRVALRAYPPSFRARYGPELAALVEDFPDSWRANVDLLLGAARAWVRPPVTSPRRRMQTTIATTWVAWCAGFLVAPAINRALLEPKVPGASSDTVQILLNIAYSVFFAGWALALLGAAPVVVRAVIPALRTHAWTTLRPMLPAVVLGAIDAAGLLWLALARHGGAAQVTDPSTLFVIASVLWLIGFAAFVCSLAVGPALSLTRLEPDVTVVRASTFVAVPVAGLLVTLTGCSLAATVIARGATLVSSTVPVVGVLAVGCLASVVALISSVRGVRALRTV